MTTGDRVLVTGKAGTVIATLEKLCAPSELPDLPIPGAPSAAIAAGILQEIGVDQVAMISYPNDAGEMLVFAAVQIRGEWQDLKGQHLTIQRSRDN